MRIDLDPPRSAGPFHLGMPFTEAERTLRELPGYRPPEPGTQVNLGFAHYRSELTLSVGRDRQGLVDAVTVYRPERDVTVLFRDIAVLDLPAEEVATRLRAITRIEMQEDGATLLAPDLLLCLWRPCVPEDPDDQFFESVLVAAPGYYNETEPRIAEAAIERPRAQEISGQESLF